MGTRGLVFIRCNGRYYVYYNHMDSYPEGLGEAIVAEIPADAEQYGAWLENMRQTYGRLSQQFENDGLCVSPKFGQPEGMASRPERYARSFLALDDRLCAPPTQALLDAGDGSIFIEWTYTIDLDRELLGVDKSVYFKLSRLPHHPGWHQYLREYRQFCRTLRENTPSDLVGDVISAIVVDGQLRDRYNSFKLVHKYPKVLEKYEPVSAPREAILAKAILTTCREYWDFIDRSYMEWTSTSPVFQEMAFAILSMAAGEVAFTSPQDLNGSFAGEGFFLIPNSENPNGQQTLLPKFLHDCHSPGADPGSAPRSNPFWLGRVLVYATPRTALVDVEEAAVATVVDNGLRQGLESFHALVFSILDFILIHVEKDKNGDVQVTRSPLLNLLYFDYQTSGFPNGPRSRGSKPPPSTDAEDGQPERQDEQMEDDEVGSNDEEDGSNVEDGSDADDDGHDEDPGPERSNDILCAARMLIGFFDVTADQYLAKAKSSMLPNEILTRFMELADHQTFSNFSWLSGCCRNYYYRNFRLNDDYAIVNKGSEVLLNDHFLLEDLASGQRIVSKLGLKSSKDEERSFKRKKPKIEIVLSPVIGISERIRMSILDEWSFTFSDISPSRPPYPGKEDMPSREYFSYYGHPDGPEPERLFELQDHLYLGSLEDAFGRYLISILQAQQNPIWLQINQPRYPSLLPYGYRMLRMEQYHCSGMRIFLRSKGDESAEEWTKTIEYAAKALQSKEHDDNWWKASGGPAIIAFRRNVKLFYYVHRRVDPPPPVTASLPQCAEIAARCMESNPRRRLVDLMPGEPISLDDKEPREKFEELVRLFKNIENEVDEWDPFTGKKRRLFGNLKRKKATPADGEDDGEDDAEEDGAGDAEEDNGM